MKQEEALVRISQAGQKLDLINSLNQELVKTTDFNGKMAVADKAARVKLHLKQAGASLELQNDAGEIGIWAEWQAAKMIEEGRESGELRKHGQRGKKRDQG